MRIRAILLSAFGLIILAAYFYGPSLHESSRLRAIRQVVRLTERTVMQVNDAWIYPADASHELLRVHVTYLGDDPNREHYMRAEIGRTPDDPRFKQTLQWQVGLPGSDRDKLWEFQNFPRDGSPIFIRLYLRSGGPGGPELVRTFSIPDRLPLAVNGGEVSLVLPKKTTASVGTNNGAAANRSAASPVLALSTPRAGGA